MNFPDLPYLIDLQQALWQWPRSRASLMVGAGMSFNAEPLAGVTANFPTWSQLVRAMFDEIYPIRPSEDTQQREQWFAGLNALALASEYEAAFGRKKLEHLIKSQVPDTEYLPGNLHKLLLQLPWTDVFTTNYDTLLERTEAYEQAYQPVIKISELTFSTPPRIIKLHGSFPSQTPFIITEEDYRRYPKDFSPFINTVRQSLLENTLVLVGFSGEDPNFLQWIGWIRDELGIRHNPIYLVGPLNLNPAKRLLLEKRGVTPIDLAPAFEGINTSLSLHASSLEWFLLSLSKARSPALNTWPALKDRRNIDLEYTPKLVGIDKAQPKEVELSNRHNFNSPGFDEEVLGVITRWKFERENYPKWLIAPEGIRNTVWIYTNRWAFSLLNGTKDWCIIDRLLIAYEINWRLELSLCPLFTDYIEIIDELINSIPALENHSITSKPDRLSFYRSNEVAEAWFSLTFALLREAREMYDKQRWEELIEKAKCKLELYPAYKDSYNYERALWHVWNIERSDAKGVLLKWKPSKYNPLANMWKAGLLAELDESHNATDILRKSLIEIRKSLLSNGQSIELLSLEGWCTYLIVKIEPVNQDFSKFDKIRDEFSERWQELKRWDCDPRVYKNHFDDILATVAPTIPKNEIKNRGFDPWNISTSLHFNNDPMSAFFPGFGYIRMHELIGIPMRLTGFDLGRTLESACVWIMPFVSFWSPALLIRSGSKKFLKESKLLSRIEVLKLNSELAIRLYDWSLSALERELNSIRGELNHKSSENEFLDILAEILSRLAFKVDQDRLNKTFDLYMIFYLNFYLRKIPFILDKHPQWMRRLFDVATIETLLSWIPEIVNANPFYELHHFYSERFPELTNYLPFERIRKHNSSTKSIKKSINDLIRRAKIENRKNCKLSIYRLLNIRNCGLMLKSQENKLSILIWKNCTEGELPDLDLWMYTYINIPPLKKSQPQVINSIREIILKNPLEKDIVSTTADGKISLTLSNHQNSLMHEIFYITKTFVPSMLYQRKDGVVWTTYESRVLLEKLYTWWESHKVVFTKDRQPSFGDPIRIRLKVAENFLCVAVLPQMDWAKESDWEDFTQWLNEVRSLDVYISSVYPYILLHRPSQYNDVEILLMNDLMLSNNRDAVKASARAIRHLVHLAQLDNEISCDIGSLLSLLIERVVFRYQVGVLACLRELSYLVVELPSIFDKQQFALMTASLVAWEYSTSLNGSSEFPDDDKPDLRSVVASFAGALFIWHQRQQPHTPLPDPIERWQKICEAEILPEVKHAFDVWEV